jgi:hypothetical protein
MGQNSYSVPKNGDASFCWTCRKFAVFVIGPFSAPHLRMPTDAEEAAIDKECGWMWVASAVADDPLDAVFQWRRDGAMKDFEMPHEREADHVHPAPYGTCNTENVASVDLPAEAFPVTIEYVAVDGTVVNKEIVEGAGVMRIQTYGQPVGVRMTCGNGHVSWTPPPTGAPG